MDIFIQKFKVHKSLLELFGRETTRVDLLAIFLGSAILTIFTQMLCLESDLSLTKKIVLALLTLDVGGGVVANFTEGTNNYYFESIKKRHLFIVIHITQPLILGWIFTNNVSAISTLTVYTLISSVIVTGIEQKSVQKTVAATMLLTGIILTYWVRFSTPALQLILLVYSIKLILAFSVNWSNSKQ